MIVSDVVFIAAAWSAVSRWQRGDAERVFLFGALVGNAGLLMVDHVHFQYNGLLIGEAQSTYRPFDDGLCTRRDFVMVHSLHRERCMHSCCYPLFSAPEHEASLSLLGTNLL